MTDTEDTPPEPIEIEQVETAARVLEHVLEERALLARLPDELRTRPLKAAGLVARPDPAARSALEKARRKAELEARREADRVQLTKTKKRQLRIELVYPTPDPDGVPVLPNPERTVEGPDLHEARTCYVCKAEFRTLHHHYDQMCGACAEFNWGKRFQSADLRSGDELEESARTRPLERPTTPARDGVRYSVRSTKSRSAEREDSQAPRITRCEIVDRWMSRTGSGGRRVTTSRSSNRGRWSAPYG